MIIDALHIFWFICGIIIMGMIAIFQPWLLLVLLAGYALFFKLFSQNLSNNTKNPH